MYPSLKESGAFRELISMSVHLRRQLGLAGGICHPSYIFDHVLFHLITIYSFGGSPG